MTNASLTEYQHDVLYASFGAFIGIGLELNVF